MQTLRVKERFQREAKRNFLRVAAVAVIFAGSIWFTLFLQKVLRFSDEFGGNLALGMVLTLLVVYLFWAEDRLVIKEKG